MSDDATRVDWPSANGEVDVADEELLELPEIANPATGSVIEALKAQRARVAEPQTFDLHVPGWRGLLVLRLGAISGAQQARLAERAQRPAGRAFADIDLLIAAFREVLGRARQSDPLQLLVDKDGDPVGLDERLADLIGLGPVSNGRDVVQVLFGGANAPKVAITAATNDWMEWARSADSEIDEDFLGE